MLFDVREHSLDRGTLVQCKKYLTAKPRPLNYDTYAFFICLSLEVDPLAQPISYQEPFFGRLLFHTSSHILFP
jgi:hypothetical protein